MNLRHRILALGALLPACLLADPGAGDSAHYRAVRERVGEGGQVFVYVDIDGYFTALGHDLTAELAAAAGDEPALAVWKQDYAALAAELGLAQLKAAGLSSRAIGPGRYANKLYLHIPEGRRGLLRLFGGAAHPFATAQLAPADTDLFVEAEFELAALYTTARQLLARLAPGAAQQLPGAEFVDPDEPSAAAVAAFLKAQARFTAFVRLNGETALSPEAEFKHDVFATLDLGGPQLLAYLRARYPKLKETRGADGRTLYTLGEAAGGLPCQPVIAVDGASFSFATSAAFLQECRARKTGLPQAPAYRAALAATAAEGNSLVYASPRLFASLHSLITSLPPFLRTDRSLDLALRTLEKRLAKIDAPAVAVMSNLPEGVLVQTAGPESLRESLPVLALATPDLAGNLLRFTLPAHVAGLQRQALLARHEAAIRENLAKISAAAQAHFAAHADAEEVAFTTLLERAPELAKIAPVAGEEYAGVTVRRDRDSIELYSPEGVSATYGRPLTDEERQKIERNLALYDEAAALHFAAHPDENTLSAYAATDAGGALTRTPGSVVGEEYDFTVERDAKEIALRTPGGTTVTHQRVPGLRWTVLKRRVQQTAAVREQLALFYSVASDYLVAHPDEGYVSGYELFGENGERPELRAVAGESYDGVRLSRGSASLSVEVPGLGTVVYEAELAPRDAAAIQENLRTLARAAAGYFKQHPEEKLVVGGELLAGGIESPIAVAGEDYETLVLERDAAAVTITLRDGRKVTADKR